MRNLIAALLLLTIAGPVMADEVAPVPTEDGEHVENAPDPEPIGCHRCVGNPDGGWSDSDYSNPTGAWTDSGGNTEHDQNHSQDWYNHTGPFLGEECTDKCEWSNAIKKQRPKEIGAVSNSAGPSGHNSTNGGGNDHSKTR